MIPNELVFAAIAFTVLLVVVPFVLMRALWLWYWRVNKRVQLLERIAGSLERLERSQAAGTSTVPLPPVARPTNGASRIPVAAAAHPALPALSVTPTPPGQPRSWRDGVLDHFERRGW